MTEEVRAGIERRFRANSGLILAMRLVTAALSLAVIPVLVVNFGVDGFGTWEATLALASAASLFQAAISGTLVWRMSNAFGQSDHHEIKRLIRLGLGVTLMMATVLWPVAWIFRDAAARFLHTPPALMATMSDIFPVIAAVVLLGSLGDTLEAALSGCQRSGIVNVIGAVAHLFNYTLVLVLVSTGGSFWSLVAGQALALAVRLVGGTVMLRRAIGGFNPWPRFPGPSDFAMARYSGLLAFGSLAATLRDQTDKIVLAALASPAWVGYYGMAARLAGLVLEVIRFVYIPALTAVGAWQAMGDWGRVRRLYAWLMTAIALFSGGIVIVVAGLIDYVMILWIGEPVPEVRVLVWLLLAGTAAASAFTGPGTAVCRGCGRPEIETVYLTINLVLNIVLTVGLVLVLGPIGTAVATGATWAIASVLFLFILHRRVELPVDASWRAVAMMLIACVLAVAAYMGSHLVALPESRQGAVAALVVAGGLAGGAYLALLGAFRLVSPGALVRGLRAMRSTAA